MRMNRRTLLKAGTGAALMPTLGIIKPKPARATAPLEMGWASRFNNTELRNNGGIVVPTSANDIFFACSCRLNTASEALGFQAYNNFSGGADHSCSIVVAQNTLRFDYLINGSSNTNFRYVLWETAAFGDSDDNWHTMILKANSQSGIVKLYRDGVSVPISIEQMHGPSGFALNFTNVTWSINGTGDAAFFYTKVGAPITINDSVIDGFYNRETGFAVRIAAGGAVSGVHPDVYVEGPPLSLPTNRAAGSWTWPGIYNDTSPSSSFTVNGTLGNVDSDPFEPGSPI